MWANRSKPTQGIVNYSTNDLYIVSRWIYIQHPASFFNLSSSSSSAAGTTCSRLLLQAALLSTLRCEALLHLGQAIPPPLHTSCSSPPTTEPHPPEPVNPRTPLRLQLYSGVFPSPARCCPGPRRCPPPWMRSAWHGQHTKNEYSPC